MYKRILILGDAGRGKTTLGKNLSEKLHIPYFDTDDFFWKVKYTEQNDREQSVVLINKIYEGDSWIMAGSTRRLIQGALEKADVIFLLKFKNIFFQYYFIIRRSVLRKEEKLIDLWNLLLHVTRKKYKKGYGSHTPPLEELISVYGKKVIELNSLRELKNYIKFLDK